MKQETLHLCNLEEVHDFSCYEYLVNENDAIVFITDNVSEGAYLKVKALFCEYKVYFIEAEACEDYLGLVNLVDKYQRTMTWK